tara:strand:+ start:1753 stop:3366 length:1614 start_codon:yes stop_codon:yes gene_type:complete
MSYKWNVLEVLEAAGLRETGSSADESSVSGLPCPLGTHDPQDTFSISLPSGRNVGSCSCTACGSTWDPDTLIGALRLRRSHDEDGNEALVSPDVYAERRRRVAAVASKFYQLDNSKYAYLTDECQWFEGKGNQSLCARLRLSGLGNYDAKKQAGLLQPAADFVFDTTTTDPVVERGGNTWLNHFRGLPLEAEDGDWSVIRQALTHLCAGDEGGLDYLLDWLAYPLQSLYRNEGGQKCLSAIIFHGVQGTGKGLIFGGRGLIRALYGYNHVVEVGKDTFSDQFAHQKLERSLFVVANEIASSSKRDAAILDKLKLWVTEPVLSLRKHYQGADEFESVFNMVFFSNHDDPLRLDPSDRRYSVFRQQDKLSEEQIAAIVQERNAGWPGASGFLHHLLQRDIQRDLAVPYENDARQRLLECSTPKHEEFARLIGELGLSSMCSDWEAEADRKGRTGPFYDSEGFIPTEILVEVFGFWCRQLNIRWPVQDYKLVNAVIDANPGAGRAQKWMKNNRRRGVTGLPVRRAAPAAPPPQTEMSLVN